MKQPHTDPHLQPQSLQPCEKTQVVLDSPFLLALRVSQEIAKRRREEKTLLLTIKGCPMPKSGWAPAYYHIPLQSSPENPDGPSGWLR